jgi:IS30 family transposase
MIKRRAFPERGRAGARSTSSVIMISQRPAEAADPAVPGHWEGDLILGPGSSAIGTVVERTTRFTMLLHFPRMRGHGQRRVRNSPAVAGPRRPGRPHAIALEVTILPGKLCRSLAWDQGAKMAQCARLRFDTGLAIYFCNPPSPDSARATRTPTACCASIPVLAK